MSFYYSFDIFTGSCPAENEDGIVRGTLKKACTASTRASTCSVVLWPCKQIRTRSWPIGTVGEQIGFTINPFLLR